MCARSKLPPDTLPVALFFVCLLGPALLNKSEWALLAVIGCFVCAGWAGYANHPRP